MEQDNSLKATVLLIHYSTEKMWTATVPAVEGVLAEGETPEIATDNVKEELQLVSDKYPEVKEQLRNQPEYLITEVKIDTH